MLMAQVQIRNELVLLVKSFYLAMPIRQYKSKKQKLIETYKLHLVFDKSVHILCIEIISSCLQFMLCSGRMDFHHI